MRIEVLLTGLVITTLSLHCIQQRDRYPGDGQSTFSGVSCSHLIERKCSRESGISN